MQTFEKPLLRGLFLRRYQRFFADVELGDSIATAHVPNTGSLKGCLKENSHCYLSKSSNPKRKLPYTLEILKVGGRLVGVNTLNANRLFEKHLLSGAEYKGDALVGCKKNLFKEVSIGENTRIDFVVSSSKLQCKPNATELAREPEAFEMIEVKSVTWKEEGYAQFPDAPTLRGQKHLEHLIKWQQKGAQCYLVFVIQRCDVMKFRAAAHVDPIYAKLLKKAHQIGIKVKAFRTHIKSSGAWRLEDEPIEIIF